MPNSLLPAPQHAACSQRKPRPLPLLPLPVGPPPQQPHLAHQLLRSCTKGSLVARMEVLCCGALYLLPQLQPSRHGATTLEPQCRIFSRQCRRAGAEGAAETGDCLQTGRGLRKAHCQRILSHGSGRFVMLRTTGLENLSVNLRPNRSWRIVALKNCCRIVWAGQMFCGISSQSVHPSHITIFTYRASPCTCRFGSGTPVQNTAPASGGGGRHWSPSRAADAAWSSGDSYGANPGDGPYPSGSRGAGTVIGDSDLLFFQQQVWIP